MSRFITSEVTEQGRLASHAPGIAGREAVHSFFAVSAAQIRFNGFWVGLKLRAQPLWSDPQPLGASLPR